MIFRNNPATPLDREPEGRQVKNIDVWWGGLEGNGGLMLILADSLRLEDPWRGSKLTVKLVVSDESAVKGARENLQNMITTYNITDVEYEVIEGMNRSFDEIFIESSKNADIIFHGLPVPGKNFTASYENISRRIENMPSTVLVLAGKDSSFSEVLEKE